MGLINKIARSFNSAEQSARYKIGPPVPGIETVASARVFPTTLSSTVVSLMMTAPWQESKESERLCSSEPNDGRYSVGKAYDGGILC
jgi:hypothetical protein